MNKYRFVKRTYRNGEITYHLQKRILLWWVNCDVMQRGNKYNKGGYDKITILLDSEKPFILYGVRGSIELTNILSWLESDSSHNIVENEGDLYFAFPDTNEDWTYYVSKDINSLKDIEEHIKDMKKPDEVVNEVIFKLKNGDLVSKEK